MQTWPASLSPYIRLMRLDKPIGIFLLLWPTLWALLLASGGWPSAKFVSIFVLGTVLMRSAGCVLNDIADRHFDGAVQRTKDRPLVNQQVTLFKAYVLAAILSVIAFLLVLQLNRLAILLAFPALFLAISYPYLKRFFGYPQAYLGIAFGFGIPMAFAAVQNQIPTLAWWMLLANIFWALAYDSAYAMVDRADDLKIGIRSSAISFGRFDVALIMLCYALFILIMAWVGYIAKLNGYYFTGLVAAALVCVYHYQLIKTRQPQACFKAFLHNNWLGFMVFLAILLSVG